MALVKNPILPGFNPDPSICRVGDDYYIATSTFEWYPGVQIHHSRDLANWNLACRPLDRASQLDMRGEPDSAGIWAPCLSHDGAQFWLVYTDMRRHHGSFKDGHNYVVTAPSITGPWSEPSRVNSSGFDPSLFHDEDGKSWFIQMIWDHRVRPNLFAGIVLQGFDRETRRLIGERKTIFHGTELALTEGPHLYKRNGWYYLLTAEGGTGYDHACTLARSRTIDGSYEIHPDKHILTAKDDPLHPIQRAGHGDLVETPDGRTYLVHLMGRPITQKRRCVQGRETGIQECEWREDDWLYVKNGPLPALETDVPGTPEPEADTKRYTFDTDKLDPDFQWLRTPEPERLFSLTERPGWLTLIGRESIGSWYEQSLIARRQTHFSYRAETEVEFNPSDEREMAGITAYYSRNALYYLAVTAHSDGKWELLVMTAEANTRGGTLAYPVAPVPLPATGSVRLAVDVDHADLRFYYALEGDRQFTQIGPRFDASILSDEASVSVGGGCFTGAFVGLCAADINGYGKPAWFRYFDYVGR